jgi:hypothetical protein
VVAKRGITTGGGAGLGEANVEIVNVSGDGMVVDMSVCGDGMSDCTRQMIDLNGKRLGGVETRDKATDALIKPSPRTQTKRKKNPSTRLQEASHVFW